jgi:hypothetical protein
MSAKSKEQTMNISSNTNGKLYVFSRGSLNFFLVRESCFLAPFFNEFFSN